MDLDSATMAWTFGQALRAAMVRAKLKQRELAAKSGIDPSNLSGLLRQAYPPRVDTVERLATALRCNTLDLLAGVITEWGIPLSREMAMVTARDRAPSEAGHATKKRAG